MRCVSALALGVVLMILIVSPPIVSDDVWQNVAGGLDIGRFRVAKEAPSGDSTVTIVRIDPKLWELKLLAISESGGDHGMTAREWCEKYKLTAAINAGMFDVDYTTHIGYMKSKEHVNSSRTNPYLSAAAFDPRRDSLPLFRIHDLDKTPLDSVLDRYHCVVQNLRLIKRPRENRWSQQNRIWSEAALGEDDQGRALFIFCGSPYSMYDLNKLLLSLPIGLVSAQHLEGGPEAQLYLKHGDTTINLAGNYESGFVQGNEFAWPIPNVIGIVPRSSDK
jgi:hypothetical protein